VLKRLAALALGLASLPAAARAGEAPCWFDGGVVVVAASVAGVAGDYILDTGSPATLLDETRAQGAGFEAKALTGEVRLAGVALADRPVAVEALDLRTWNLPTAVAGVIGADVLRAYVVDVSFAPCRVRVSEPGRAPAFRGRSLPLAWESGLPTAEAAVSDGAHELQGPFVLATGANAPVRLADDLATVPNAAKPDELSEQGVWLARLPELRLAGERLPDLGAGLMKPLGGTAGLLGAQALARFRLRFDFPAGRVIVARGK
jgi:hypothetical protein